MFYHHICFVTGSKISEVYFKQPVSPLLILRVHMRTSGIFIVYRHVGRYVFYCVEILCQF